MQASPPGSRASASESFGHAFRSTHLSYGRSARHRCRHRSGHARRRPIAGRAEDRHHADRYRRAAVLRPGRGLFKNAGISADTQIISNGGAITAASSAGRSTSRNPTSSRLPRHMRRASTWCSSRRQARTRSKDATTALVVQRTHRSKRAKISTARRSPATASKTSRRSVRSLGCRRTAATPRRPSSSKCRSAICPPRSPPAASMPP